MPAHEETQEQIRQFPARCRAAGLKVTHQRTAIFSMLAETRRHPTPEEVYESVRHELPSISLATVYKVLDLFHRYGFLRRVSTEHQVARYDAHVAPHHHLVCDGCGVIQDVELAPAADALSVPDPGDFAVTGYDIIFHGLCGDCRRAGAA